MTSLKPSTYTYIPQILPWMRSACQYISPTAGKMYFLCRWCSENRRMGHWTRSYWWNSRNQRLEGGASMIWFQPSRCPALVMACALWSFVYLQGYFWRRDLWPPRFAVRNMHQSLLHLREWSTDENRERNWNQKQSYSPGTKSLSPLD